MNLELITNFSINKTFDEAYADSEEMIINNHKFMRCRIVSFEDLITSKLKANRPKDLLDIQQLREINSK